MKDSDWEILYELHKNPNMTKVANLLYMTQPSLTKRIQHMEEEFQIQIVNRTPKGLEFTREGDFLAEKAEEYLKFLKKTREELKGMKEKSKGEIVIGSSSCLPQGPSEYQFQHHKRTEQRAVPQDAG